MATKLVSIGNGVKSTPLSALTNWEEWGVTWGNPDTTQHSALELASLVGFLFRAVDLRANSVTAVPWAIYAGNAKKPLWQSGEPQAPAALAAYRDLSELIYRTEAALCLTARAYWFRERNRVRTTGLRWLDPVTMEPVWTPQGITGYKRLVNGAQIVLPPDDVVYIWMSGLSETEPRTPPAQAAAADANVLYNVDTFAASFFKRGAIKATLLTVDGQPLPAERERLKTWWQKFMSGLGNAFSAEVVSAAVQPVVVGEGISELSNTALVEEKRQGIATAMGVPHTLVMSNAANYATAEADTLNFYQTTIVPQCNLIERQLNAQLFEPAGLRFVFQPQSLDVFQQDENNRAAAFAAYVNAGIKQSIVAQMLGLELPEGIAYEDLDPEPQPVPLVAAQEDAQDEAVEDEQERVEEEKRFLRWAKKRRAPDVTQFKSTLLSDADKEALLGQSATPFEVADGPITPEWVKAMVLRLDPDDDEAEQRIRDALDRRSEREIARALQEWQQSLFVENATPAEVQQAVNGLAAPQRVKDVLQRALIDGADLGVSVAVDQLGSIGFDYSLALAEAREWAGRYTYELVRGIEDTSRRVLSESVSRWVENGEPLSSLVKDIEPVFGRQRARAIAQTETTRAYQQGAAVSYRESGVVAEMEWRTARDEAVCPVCGPKHGQRMPLESTDVPPAHPNCRCWTAPVVKEAERG